MASAAIADPLLEVAAGLRSHHRAREGEHPARGSATAHVCDRRYHAVDHAAAEHPGITGERPERRDALETGDVVPDDAPLPPSDRACALACAHLRLAAAGLCLGSAHGLSVGCITAARDRRPRED